MTSIEKAIERLRRERQKEQSGSQGLKSSTEAPRVTNESIQVSDIPAEQFLELSPEFLSKSGFLTPDVEDTVLAEEYRHIKRPLLANIAGKGADRPEYPNIIVVTSALPGEGKSFTAMNLAMSLAMEKDNTVLLVDSDVVNPALSRIFGVSESPGLIDLLLERNIDVPNVLYHTGVAKLKFVPGGKIHSHATELLASAEMRLLVNQLSTRYSDRIVILDAPPLLLTSHARVLTDLAGQILLVVEAGATLQHDVLEAVGQLDRNKIIGLVLNKSRRKYSGSYYYGGYSSQSNRSANGV